MAREKKVSPIFEIIQKLGKGEKRSFNIYASSYDRKSNSVITLFNIIYDYTHALPEDAVPQESAIAPQLKKAKLTAQYTNIKNRLKVLLFDYIYDREVSREPRVASGRKATLGVILRNNNHTEIGSGLLKEAKKESAAREDLMGLLQCLESELLNMGINGYQKDEDYLDVLLQIKDTLQEMNLYSEAIYLEMLSRKYNHQKAAMPAELSDTEKILQKIAASRVVKTKNLLYKSLTAVSFAQDPLVVTAGYIEANLSMLEGNEDPLFLSRYFNDFINYMLVLYKIGEVDKYREQLQKMEAKLLRYRGVIIKSTISHLDVNIILFKVRVAILAHDAKAVGVETGKLETEFIRLYKEHNLQTIILNSGYIRDSYFYGGNYEKAYYWATEGTKNLDLPLHSILNGYIIELVSACELRHDHESFNSIVRKIRLNLERKAAPPAMLQFMEGLISHVRDLAAARSIIEYKGHIEAIQDLCDKTLALGDIVTSAGINNSFLKEWIAVKLL